MSPWSRREERTWLGLGLELRLGLEQGENSGQGRARVTSGMTSCPSAVSAGPCTHRSRSSVRFSWLGLGSGFRVRVRVRIRIRLRVRVRVGLGLAMSDLLEAEVCRLRRLGVLRLHLPPDVTELARRWEHAHVPGGVG
eukprot:scaffold81012_cov53-Phaeocystis_antarctica.AAC.4